MSNPHLPDELLLPIVQHLKLAADDTGDLTFYTLTYTGARLRLMATEVFHGQNPQTWSRRRRQTRMAKLRKAEGRALIRKAIERYDAGDEKGAERFRECCNVVKMFDRTPPVEAILRARESSYQQRNLVIKPL